MSALANGEQLAGASEALPGIEIRTQRIRDDREIRLEERRLLFGSDQKEIYQSQGAGLAFSGGGIRSASFGLGVLQALLNRDLLQCFDYLSTVSGGGYLGSAITWLMNVTGGDTQKFKAQFGTQHVGARKDSAARNVWLDYIRQHGNYLTPGRMSDLGLVGAVLRGLLFNVAVYGAVLVALMAILVKTHVLADPEATHVIRPWLTIESAVLFVALVGAGLIALHAIGTWIASLRNLSAVSLGFVLLGGMGWLTVWLWRLKALETPRDHWNIHWPIAGAAAIVLIIGASSWRSLFAETIGGQITDPIRRRASHKWQYRARVLYQSYLGGGLGALSGLLLVWSLPYVFSFVTAGKNGWIWPSASTAVGVAGAVYQFFKGRSKGAMRPGFSGVRVTVTAMLLLYGLLLLSFGVGDRIAQAAGAWREVVGALLICAAIFGYLVNINYFGLGRMYRDRLMEAFLPNREAVLQCRWDEATEADEAKLVEFRYLRDGNLQRPLHLLNCNVVLVDAQSDKYRGRGGDSFVLSPWYSGSDATGWMPTNQLGDGTLTLASAMATSGAAVNPNVGVGGRGVTRDRFVSFLMSFLNMRLGYWLPNRLRGRSFWPNLWMPGIRQGLMGRGLDEKARFLELTDGGHFDNTGLYELIRRRVKIIVLCEGGQDDGYQMEDLADAIERVRTDFGVYIRFDCPQYPLSAIRPDEISGLSVRGFSVGRIEYPTPSGSEIDHGVLLYLQLSPVSAMPADTDSYRRHHPDFPNQSTMDQFFNEEQTEAYRELGFTVADEALHMLEQEVNPEHLGLQLLKRKFTEENSTRPRPTRTPSGGMHPERTF